MAFEQAYPADMISVFKLRVLHRLKELASESGENDFLMPIGLFFLIDKQNGGDATAQELAQRFNLLDLESRNVLDFYFLGWKATDPSVRSKGIAFDLQSFEACRQALRNAGIRRFGGNADLLLVDARYVSGRVALNFTEAIHIDLSRAQAEKEFATLGGYLQSIIEAAESLREIGKTSIEHGAVFSISDHLGLAISKKSFLDYIFEKFGKFMGAKELANVAVRNIGPNLSLADIK